MPIIKQDRENMSSNGCERPSSVSVAQLFTFYVAAYL